MRTCLLLKREMGDLTPLFIRATKLFFSVTGMACFMPIAFNDFHFDSDDSVDEGMIS